MTTEDIDRPRLRGIIDELERMLAGPAGPNPTALPPSVAAGELITSAWGNAVVIGLTQSLHMLGGQAWSSTTQTGLTQTFADLTTTTVNYTVPSGYGNLWVSVFGSSAFSKLAGDTTSDVSMRLIDSTATQLAITTVQILAPGTAQAIVRSQLNQAPGAYTVKLQAKTAAGFANATERVVTVQFAALVT